MKRGIFAYLCNKLKRHALINFLLFLELTLALVFGATGLESLAAAQSGIEKYPSEYERLSAVSGIYGDEEKNASILEICEGKDYSFIYPFTIKNVILETAWEGQIVQASVAELMSYKLEEGQWFDTSETLKDGVRQAVADDVFCKAFGCSLGDVITVEYGIDGKYFPLEVKIIGINDYSSTGIGVGYDGTLFRSNVSADDGMITVLADDGDLSFYDGGAFTAFRLDMPGDDKQAFMQAGIRRVTESVAEDYDEYYKEQTNTRNIMLMLCVSVMLLAASTSLTTSAITFGRQRRENAIAFACGLSGKNAIVCEAVKDGSVLVFALFVAGAVSALIAYTGMMPGVNGMSGFAISAAIVSVLYAAIRIPFLVALGKTEPIEGIKEKTI